MNIKFRYVRTRRAMSPGVTAYADNLRVEYQPAKGWECDCGTTDCPHITAVRNLVSDAVTTEPA